MFSVHNGLRVVAKPRWTVVPHSRTWTIWSQPLGFGYNLFLAAVCIFPGPECVAPPCLQPRSSAWHIRPPSHVYLCNPTASVSSVPVFCKRPVPTLQMRGESVYIFQATDVMWAHEIAAVTALLSVYFLILIIKPKCRPLPALHN